MKRRRILIVVLGVLVVAAAGGLYARFGRDVPLAIVAAAQGEIPIRVTGPGTLQARIPVTLSARITAAVKQLNADVGDTVRRGQVLAVLDDRDLAARRGVVGGQLEAQARNVAAARAAVTKAQADLDLARSKQRRDEELLRTGFVSPSVLDASDAALRAAEANLDNARAALAARQAEVGALGQEAHYSDTVLSFTRITAPMDGVVIARDAEVGAILVPGAPLFRIVDPATLWIAMRVDESVVGRVAIGQPAQIRMRTGQMLNGKVARIARQSDAATRELEVNVAFDTAPAHFAIDQEAEVAIDTGRAAGIVVPASAIVRNREGAPGVLGLDESSRTRFRPVQAGGHDAQQVLIRHGLAAGERVVARAQGVGTGLRARVPDSVQTTTSGAPASAQGREVDASARN
jgi:RND family efflux transporter MFP subunit